MIDSKLGTIHKDSDHHSFPIEVGIIILESYPAMINVVLAQMAAL